MHPGNDTSKHGCEWERVVDSFLVELGWTYDAVSGCRHTENVQGAQRTKSREQKAHLNGRQNGSRWI